MHVSVYGMVLTASIVHPPCNSSYCHSLVRVSMCMMVVSCSFGGAAVQSRAEKERRRGERLPSRRDQTNTNRIHSMTNKTQ